MNEESVHRNGVVEAVRGVITFVAEVVVLNEIEPVPLDTQHSAVFHCSLTNAVPSGTVVVAVVVVAVEGNVNDGYTCCFTTALLISTGPVNTALKNVARVFTTRFVNVPNAEKNEVVEVAFVVVPFDAV